MLAIGGNAASTGYNLTRSLRFRASASAYLNRTFTTPTNNKIWTLSFWVKRGLSGSFLQLFASRPTTTPYSLIYFGNTNNFQFDDNGSLYFATSQLFRDPAAWYHIIIAVDTTQATSTNRFKLYVNGAQVTAFSSATYPSQNYNTQFNTASSHAIGKGGVVTNEYFDGYLTEINFIDGQQLTPSSFGSTNTLTGVWQPARYTGTYGTNGFYLPFTDNSALTTSSNAGLGKDFSGNGNYWTTNNISITAGVTYDSMTDVCTLTSATAANFAVLNPLKSYYAPTNGNLSMSTGSSVTGIDVASISLGTGIKYYFEATATGTAQQIGIFSSNHALTPTGSKRYWYLESGGLYNDLTLLQTVATFTSGDTIAVAWDGTAQTVTFYKNNTQQGTAISVDTSYSYFFGVGAYNGGWNANFGQRPFSYTPPSGFLSLNTFNLPTSTIVKGNTVMDIALWSGNGSSQTITNSSGLKPDLVWVKARSFNAQHLLVDSVRGANGSVMRTVFSSNQNAEESTNSSTNLTYGLVSSINSNGLSVNTGSTNANQTNASGNTYVAWQWQAGQGSSSSNTNGTITSTVSVNASAGFSVVTYTGTGAAATVGHGLGVAPQLIIGRSRTNSGFNWGVWHISLQTLYGNAAWIRLNTTDSYNTSFDVFDPQNNTSSVFGIGSEATMNASASNFIAYCWTPIAGYSAFGSYTGNGSTDGVFVYTGFRPLWVLIKRTDAVGDWYTFDSVRDPYNATAQGLSPNASASETSYTGWGDLLSNGFKIRRTDAAWNGSGATYIYMAYAENPFRNALAR